MNYFNLFFFTLVILVLAGCDTSVMEDGEAQLAFDLQPTVNGAALSTDSGVTYDINGATLSFESARMYLSAITLIRNDNSTIASEGELITVPAKGEDDEDISHTVSDRVVLAKHDTGVNQYDIGTWPAGEYAGIRFKVGIAGTTNRIDPSQVPAAHPLAKQTDRNNHWNWNAGYLFLRIDGQVDTDNDTVPDEEWAVHLGTAKFLKEVTLMKAFTLNDGDHAALKISLNYGALLADVDLNDPGQRICHTMNNLPVANAVASKIADAYTFEGLSAPAH